MQIGRPKVGVDQNDLAALLGAQHSQICGKTALADPALAAPYRDYVFIAP